MSLEREIGARIRWLRQAKNWSQFDLARRAGVNGAYIGTIERGERSPTVRTLSRIADALEIQVTDLLPHGTMRRSIRTMRIIADAEALEQHSELQEALANLGATLRELARDEEAA